MKGLSPGRRLALVAGIAALVAGIVIAIVAGGGRHSAHRRPASADARVPTTGSQPRQTTGGAAPAAKAKAKAGRSHSGSAAKGAGGRRSRPRAGAAHPGLFQVAARYLGMAPTQVRHEVASGHTLAQVADARPGRSAAGLVDALVAARTAVIRAATAEGRISGDVANRRLSKVHRQIANAVAHGRLGAPAIVAVALGQAARYLGEDVQKLRDQLRKGRTLAQIADATPGRSAAGLVDALVAIRKTALDGLVKAGHLKKEREQAIIAAYRARLVARIRQRAG